MIGRRRVFSSTQGGFTLIEVIVAVALAALLLTAITSVVLTAWRGTTIASGRVEASSEIRNFQSEAYGDFAGSGAPSAPGCGTPAKPCTTQALVLTGTRVSNGSSPAPTTYQVAYAWDGSSLLDREDASTGVATHVATDVTGFAWYVDGTEAHPTVVVKMTVTVNSYNESQAFRFYPRPNP